MAGCCGARHEPDTGACAEEREKTRNADNADAKWRHTKRKTHKGTTTAHTHTPTDTRTRAHTCTCTHTDKR